MGEKIRMDARREASRLLHAHWDGSLPVRLTEMSVAIGAHKYEADLGSLLTGLVTKEPFGDPRIALNSTHSAARRRFTWAHELGHIVESVLAGNENEYEFVDTLELVSGGLEVFADEFARALLIPEAELRRLQADDLTPGQIARVFAVTVGAIDSRIEDLALTASEVIHA
ncbi:ImmA/IrrE family metallo-endopeptidase [Microbacterium sp. NPDC058389]|uniref:ImmA/IrrE family metallo-endopeptidase n=1 Tax=Microbacterium sp. NPDC058389 TaxID=3346475 RepID=UPI00365702E0